MSDEESEAEWKSWARLGGLLLIFVWWADVDVPDWAVVAGVGAIGAIVVAYIASGKIEGLFDDPRPVRLIQINAVSEPVAAWKMSRDKFDDLQVEWGPLYPHTEGEWETYEAYAYDPDRNVAVGTWRRHSVPGSELVGRHDVDDVEQVIADLRGRLEPEARRGREIRLRLPSIARSIDFERSEAMNAALDPSSPNRVSKRTVDEILNDELPDELLPGSIANADLSSLLEESDDVDDWDEGMDLIIDEEGDALEPTGELANDGGVPDG